MADDVVMVWWAAVADYRAGYDYQSFRGTTPVVTGSDRFWYDALGRTSDTERFIDRVRHEMSFSYDPAGRLDQVHYPDPSNPSGEDVKYTYDSAGRLTAVGGYLTDATYNAAGQPTSLTYGNGLTEERRYNPHRGWLDRQTLANPTASLPEPLYSASYIHDNTARVTEQVIANRTDRAGRLTSLVESFAYDDLGRLTAHNWRPSQPGINQPTASQGSATFAYDAIGRITSTPPQAPTSTTTPPTCTPSPAQPPATNAPTTLQATSPPRSRTNPRTLDITGRRPACPTKSPRTRSPRPTRTASTTNA